MYVYIYIYSKYNNIFQYDYHRQQLRRRQEPGSGPRIYSIKPLGLTINLNLLLCLHQMIIYIIICYRKKYVLDMCGHGHAGV